MDFVPWIIAGASLPFKSREDGLKKCILDELHGDLQVLV